jgi:UDP-hydrolysing UDP-N-acetyl-D-glucosamine 2-epimerase
MSSLGKVILMTSNTRTICVVLVDRANYGRMHPVMRAIQNDSQLKLLTLCAGTMLLERFGQAENIVAKDGFNVDGRVFLEVEGSVPVTMAKSIGLGIIEFASEFQRLKPDVILLIGDRYEALAASVAAAYMNLPLAHIQGGEVSGSIDESARHAITKFAHLHFASTERAASYLRKMGECPEYVFNVGCPSGDYIRQLDTQLTSDMLEPVGVGAKIDINNPFFLVIFHPVTTEFGSQKSQAEQLIQALHELSHPAIWVWPNIDAGSDGISKALRVYREHHDATWLHLVKNLEPVIFQKLLKRATCAIGNSSSFIRDSTFSGTPVVLVGDRQVGREHGPNLMVCKPSKSAILRTIQAQVKVGRYPMTDLYGDGSASQRIVEQLRTFRPYVQKQLHYIFDGGNRIPDAD